MPLKCRCARRYVVQPSIRLPLHGSNLHSGCVEFYAGLLVLHTRRIGRVYEAVWGRS